MTQSCQIKQRYIHFTCILCLLNNTCVKHSVHVSNLFWSREYNSAKEICKYASFSKVGGNYPLDLKIIWSSDVDIKIKLIRYDPNGVPNFFPLNNATCIYPVLYDVYVLDLHWQQSFVYITNVYFKQWPGEFRVIFGIRKCA